jgi:hypothetical protein
MAGLLVDLENYIINLGLATADGVDIYRDYLPDTPDAVITLYEYSGEPFANGVDGMLRMIQILVRAKSYAGARLLSWSLYNAFHTPDDYIHTLGGKEALIRVRSTPLKMLADETSRVTFTFNMGVTTQLD